MGTMQNTFSHLYCIACCYIWWSRGYEQCFIGVNATLRDRIKIGDRCVIGAGALLLGDAELDGVYLETTARS